MNGHTEECAIMHKYRNWKCSPPKVCCTKDFDGMMSASALMQLTTAARPHAGLHTVCMRVCMPGDVSLQRQCRRLRTVQKLIHRNRRTRRANVTRAATTAAEVEHAAQQDAPTDSFDWHRQWYPVSWET